jgi:hypothetical protein
MVLAQSLQTLIATLLQLFSWVAWIIIPLFLAGVFFQMRLLYKRAHFLEKQKWDFLEVRIAEENLRTPKAMEQVFASLYGIYSFGIPWINKHKDGKVDLWISFEMVGRAGGINFYVRTPSSYRNLVEAALYAQYPDIEISEAQDYIYDFGRALPNDTYDVWGGGFKQVKDGVYPIRTHQQFEEVKEEKTVDPLAGIFEAMSKLKDDEMICLQYMISPTGAATGYDAKAEAEKEIKKLIEEKGLKRKNSEGKEEPATSMFSLTPGMQDVVKSIERKVSQLLFETTIRFMYVDRKDDFNMMNVAAVMGSMQQFNTQDMNALRPDSLLTVFGGWQAVLFPWYKKMKIASKKRRLFYYYATRRFGMSNHLGDEKLPIFNVEELATLFHFPRSFIKAPNLKSAYSRRGGPPSNLPIEEL